MASSRTRLGELFETTLIERGRPVRLEFVIRRPAGEGPFPLVVFNHGSTGNGKSRTLIRRTVEIPVVTRFFNERGWMVLYPQRRGRGKSEGLYDEGLQADPAKGYSCETDVALRGLDRAVDDLDAVMTRVRGFEDVRRDRILMAGVSRGGALSIAWAGHAPGASIGAISFSGGWLGRACADSYVAVNRDAFLRGVPSGTPTLWLCGSQDTYYRLSHCRAVHAAFVEAGGIGTFETFAAGHGLVGKARLWAPPVDGFLAGLADHRDSGDRDHGQAVP